MLTADELQTIMPRLPVKKNGELLPFLQAAMTEFAIEAPARAAAFLAQVAHESGQFRFMEEIWGPTDAQKRYEPPNTLAARLGNTQPGDGKRFKGRGAIQLTGRANYSRFGTLLGLDLVSDPARAAAPDAAFRTAGLFWSKNGLNELSDLATDDAFRAITKRINGGFNGLADRQAFYQVACTTLGVIAAPVSRGTSRDRQGPDAGRVPVFTRGAEAVRAHARRRRVRTTRKPTRRAKSGAHRKVTSKHKARRRLPPSKRRR